jgi:hypothetical protein
MLERPKTTPTPNKWPKLATPMTSGQVIPSTGPVSEATPEEDLKLK